MRKLLTAGIFTIACLLIFGNIVVHSLKREYILKDLRTQWDAYTTLIASTPANYADTCVLKKHFYILETIHHDVLVAKEEGLRLPDEIMLGQMKFSQKLAERNYHQAALNYGKALARDFHAKYVSDCIEEDLHIPPKLMQAFQILRLLERMRLNPSDIGLTQRDLAILHRLSGQTKSDVNLVAFFYVSRIHGWNRMIGSKGVEEAE